MNFAPDDCFVKFTPMEFFDCVLKTLYNNSIQQSENIHDSVFLGTILRRKKIHFLNFPERIFFIISNPSSPQDLKNKLNYYSSYCSTKKKLLKPCTFLRVLFLNNCFLFGLHFFPQEKQRQRSP